MLRKTIAACVVTALVAGAGTASAAKLITSRDIADGAVQNRDIARDAISLNRLSPTVRALLAKAGTAGVNGRDGVNGIDGLNGKDGVSGTNAAAGANGIDGTNGKNGTNGTNGTNGINPAVPVKAGGDQGWTFMGAPAARLTGGELRLGGGFDSSTPSGGIGIAKAYNNALGTLSALSYSYHVNKRPLGNTVSAPTIHVTLTGAKRTDSATSTFTNLVFEPYQNETVVTHDHDIDAAAGVWWSTRSIAGSPDHGTLRSLADIARDNPDAVIAAISLDNGGSSANTIPVDQFDAGADNLLVGFGSEFVRYDLGG